MPRQRRKPASLDDVLRSVDDLAERIETVAPRSPSVGEYNQGSSLQAAISDGQLRVTVECWTPINKFIANRWQLLTEAEGLTRMEDRSYVGRSFDPVEELDQYLHPFWGHYDDLHFAQLLFQAAVSEWIDRKPWRGYVDDDREMPRRVSSEDRFLADIETWARQEEPEDVGRLRKAGQAALRLDVRAMRKVLAPMLARDEKQSEQEGRELRAILDVDDSPSARDSAREQESAQPRGGLPTADPRSQVEGNDVRARKAREKALAATVAELKKSNRARARAATSPQKDARRQPNKS